ncbi:sigma-70 family RNA polymerase sigma factor [Sporosarcina thermotolerans]|uniref:Sigma-70 family RNA polymerase sigma factor n=1 Tax=Sporosarcina thermotolerans TaxID=633404 RepID=A0AAW9A873_9BACL|nr:sigma-70 family RNA polymerase sigma factor [Sporosarcina thermotolerans]MDW0116550.1 sigma-70 family RNA polymerase sigma factor [Sporosarcina thermotolerans]WHT48770.1 sigma-70 family RNA polymerase sigma factor [Sporosarcina thermotolerans]
MRTHENNFIKRLQSGKEDALDFIVDRYLPLIKSVVRQVLGPVRQEELIGECVNDIFHAIWQNAKKFRGRNPDEFKNWICAVAKYKAIDYYRKEAKNIEVASEFIEIPVEVSKVAEDRVKELLNELEPMDQKIFIMRYLLGFSSEETAEKLGLSISAIDNRVYRGKKRLRQNGRFSYEGHI